MLNRESFGKQMTTPNKKKKPGLWANMNSRKKKGISRPKSKSTVTAKAYSNMKKGFPKKKKV
jgi:hypothetical protein